VSLARIPLVAAAVGLAVALTATLSLHRSATGALDRVLEERLRGAGTVAAELLADVPPTPERLRAIMAANALEGAYVLSPELLVLADATGPAGARADLLRLDAERVARALRGEATVAFGYAVGDLPVASGYFPIAGAGGVPRAVLALEAGESFSAARAGVRRALLVAVLVSVLGAASLAALGVHWARTEAQRRAGAERAAREMRSRAWAPWWPTRSATRSASSEARWSSSASAAAARSRQGSRGARGRARRGRAAPAAHRRLPRSAREPSIAPVDVDAAIIAEDAARALARSPARGRPARGPGALRPRRSARLRQVLSNLLQNAAEAGAGRVDIRGVEENGAVLLEVRDDGRGIDPALRERLFEPFATGRKDGAGLGLAIARRIVERHGGELRLVARPGPGAAFEVRLPRAPG
jgi:two-component sensor histidine kinase